jgi:hypothetical protein
MQLFLHAMSKRSHALLPTSMLQRCFICTAVVVTDARKIIQRHKETAALIKKRQNS